MAQQDDQRSAVNTWTDDQWEEWRAENRRLLVAGAVLGTTLMPDGSTEELIVAVEALLVEAAVSKDEMGAVNWGDLGIVDIEYRLSMMYPRYAPSCIVMIEEASPDSRLAAWLNGRLDRSRFPNTWIECEW